jgi:hypothetical protein
MGARTLGTGTAFQPVAALQRLHDMITMWKMWYALHAQGKTHNLLKTSYVCIPYILYDLTFWIG